MSSLADLTRKRFFYQYTPFEAVLMGYSVILLFLFHPYGWKIFYEYIKNSLSADTFLQGGVLVLCYMLLALAGFLDALWFTLGVEKKFTRKTIIIFISLVNMVAAEQLFNTTPTFTGGNLLPWIGHSLLLISTGVFAFWWFMSLMIHTRIPEEQIKNPIVKINSELPSRKGMFVSLVFATGIFFFTLNFTLNIGLLLTTVIAYALFSHRITLSFGK